MTDLEELLRDAFAAHERRVMVPPLRQVSRPRRRTGRVLLVAAAVATIATTATMLAVVDRDPDKVEVVTSSVSPDEFNGLASGFCAYVNTHRPHLGFATLDGFRVVATGALELIDDAQVKLLALPAPNDDPDLLTAVSASLASSAERARHVLDLVELGRLNDLPQAWEPVNVYLASALQQLAAHGAGGCR